jgi:hypothetical protein
MEKITFTYRFNFEDGRKKEFHVHLDAKTGHLIASPGEKAAAWTALEHKKCSHCPLNAKDSPQCPIAANLSGVANDFKQEKSYHPVNVEVVSAQRTYTKTLPLQDALFGLFGLIMATSGCPYMSFLKPMARYHLPFSSIEETFVRTASFYLFKQYFTAKKGGTPDFALANFSQLYSNLNLVNRGIIARIRSIAKADADANSIVSLDAFASLLPLQIKTDFAEFAQIFD